jgi:hypothetical protein
MTGHDQAGQMKLMVFLHGTALMHSAARGVERPERVRQVREREPSVHDFAAYVPAEGVVEKLACWSAQGAEIVYLSSHRRPENVAADAEVVARHRFPAGRILAREPDESYGQVVARELPDVLIEDDCESIGAEEIAHPQVPMPVRSRVGSVIVPEMGGLAHLPDALDALRALAERDEPNVRGFTSSLE